MALIIAISYSINQAEDGTVDTLPVNVPSDTPANILQSTGFNTNPLTPKELQEAMEAGNAAITARKQADEFAKPLPSESPDSRHQGAVSTSLKADRLALAGVAEIAATKKLETDKSFMGQASVLGSFLDGGWAPPEVCEVAKLEYPCNTLSDRYRTFDGSCNRVLNLGSAFTPYRRGLPPDYADGISEPRKAKDGTLLPSAREVSLKVCTLF